MDTITIQRNNICMVKTANSSNFSQKLFVSLVRVFEVESLNGNFPTIGNTPFVDWSKCTAS